MQSFSERYGYAPARMMQSESMDQRLRNRIANCLHEYTPMKDDYIGFEQVIDTDFAQFFLDRMGFKWKGNARDVIAAIDRIIDEAEWHDVYTMIERFAYSLEEDQIDAFVASLSDVLEEEKAGYKPIVVNDSDKQCLIVPLTNNLELNEIDAACHTVYDSVNSNIETAIRLFADRKNPDYANAVKSAISAVESAFCIVDGKAKTLGDAIKHMRKGETNMNQRFIDGLEKLYAYANETVRHGTSEPVEITQSEAKLMIVTCSVIANFILAEQQG